LKKGGDNCEGGGGREMGEGGDQIETSHRTLEMRRRGDDRTHHLTHYPLHICFQFEFLITIHITQIMEINYRSKIVYSSPRILSKCFQKIQSLPPVISSEFSNEIDIIIWNKQNSNLNSKII